MTRVVVTELQQVTRGQVTGVEQHFHGQKILGLLLVLIAACLGKGCRGTQEHLLCSSVEVLFCPQLLMFIELCLGDRKSELPC